MERKNKSPVSKFFIKDSARKRTICRLCGEEFKYRYTTTNLRVHLKKYHPEWLTDCGMNSTPSEQQVITYDTELIGEMISLDFQNISIVEEMWFRKFIKEHVPHSLPSPKTIVEQAISEINEINCKAMHQVLNKCKYVSISAYLWTNSKMKDFLTLTAHFFSDDRYMSCVLNAVGIHNHYSSEDLASVIHAIFVHFHILEKITAIVAFDDTLKAACSILNITHLPCIAQLLNAIMTEVLTQNDDAQVLLQRCQNLVPHFKMIPSTNDELLVEEIEPPLWYSAFHMFQRLVEMKELLSTTLVALPQGAEPLASTDWLNLDDFITVLKPFELMTSELSLDFYSSISKVEPLMRSVQSILHNVTCTTDLGAALKESLLEKLDDQLSTYKKYIIPSVATFLDPRFKRVGLEATLESTCNFVVEQLFQLKNTTNSADNENIRKHENSNFSKVWNFYVKKVSELSSKKAPSNSAEMSVKRYLDQPYLKLHDCPFKFWISQSYMEPELADIAIKFMSIPATCISADRFYSKVGIMEK